jgi:hydrogenase maturation protease
MQIIGCGDHQRGDDAAGLLVVERLQNLGIEALGAKTGVCNGETTAVMNFLAGDADLIIIDAVVRGAAVGTIHLWHGIPPVSNRVAMSSHGMGLGEAMRLAKTLGRLPNTLRVYGIEGKTFEIGSPVSYEVHESVETLAWQIKAEIEIKTSGQTI